VVSNFYRDDEILTAKQLLIQNVDTSVHASIQPYICKRIGDNKTERSVEDTVNVIRVTDEHDSRDLLSIFCASSMTHIPTMPDDMSDVAVIRSKFSDLRWEFNNVLNAMAPSVTMPTTRHVKQPHGTSVDIQNTLRPPAIPPATVSITANDNQTDAETEDISDVQTITAIQPGDFATVVRQNCNKYKEMHRKNRQKKKGITGESVQENNTIKGVAKKSSCVNEPFRTWYHD